LHTDESATNQLIFRNCCRTCGQARPREAFYHDRTTASGRQASCKDCQKQRAAAWQRAHPERHRAHVSAWKASHPEEVRRHAGLTRSRRGQEARDVARLVGRVASATRRAVTPGLLARPDRCSGCGREGVVLDAIHEDYARPLEVVWLCRRCHYRWSHARRRAAGGNP
jgi:hypothetical protein